MKNSTLISLLIILLTACAAPVASPTATVTALPSASPLPSATATETMTPSPTGTPTAPPLPSITLVTSYKEMKAHPEALPRGRTPGERTLLSESIRQMFERREIPNFDESVPNISDVVTFVVNHNMPVYENYFNVADASSWATQHNPPMRGVTLVDGGNGTIYAVQAVKQRNSNLDFIQLNNSKKQGKLRQTLRQEVSRCRPCMQNISRSWEPLRGCSRSAFGNTRGYCSLVRSFRQWSELSQRPCASWD